MWQNSQSSQRKAASLPLVMLCEAINQQYSKPTYVISDDVHHSGLKLGRGVKGDGEKTKKNPTTDKRPVLYILGRGKENKQFLSFIIVFKKGFRVCICLSLSVPTDV